MKPFTVAAAVAVIATVVAAGQARQPADPQAGVKQEIMRIENERNRAVVDGDAAALDRLTAADYSFITLRGELRTKDEIVKGFKSGSFHYDTRTISDLTVRVYGDTAVVVGRPVTCTGHRRCWPHPVESRRAHEPLADRIDPASPWSARRCRPIKKSHHRL